MRYIGRRGRWRKGSVCHRQRSAGFGGRSVSDPPDRRLQAVTGDPNRFATGSRLASYAGLAPIDWQSGTSTNGSFHSPGGNHRLKNAMFIAAFVATRHDPSAKAYYKRKRDEGKKHNAAVICVAQTTVRPHPRNVEDRNHLRRQPPRRTTESRLTTRQEHPPTRSGHNRLMTRTRCTRLASDWSEFGQLQDGWPPDACQIGRMVFGFEDIGTEVVVQRVGRPTL